MLVIEPPLVSRKEPLLSEKDAAPKSKRMFSALRVESTVTVPLPLVLNSAVSGLDVVPSVPGAMPVLQGGLELVLNVPLVPVPVQVALAAEAE